MFLVGYIDTVPGWNFEGVVFLNFLKMFPIIEKNFNRGRESNPAPSNTCFVSIQYFLSHGYKISHKIVFVDNKKGF